MAGEFVIGDFKNMGGDTLLVSGKVESGEISEGDVGKTLKSKRLAVIKIEKKGIRAAKVAEKEQVNIFVKYIVPADIGVGQSLFF